MRVIAAKELVERQCAATSESLLRCTLATKTSTERQQPGRVDSRANSFELITWFVVHGGQRALKPTLEIHFCSIGCNGCDCAR
jgi:hypothetical protein